MPITAAAPTAHGVSPVDRLEVLFAELAELTGQRNAIDGQIVDVVAEIDRDGLWGATGARSVPALVAWKTGTSLGNARTIATVAHRVAEFPRCAAGMRAGRFSLDQVGVIAERAGEGSDAHYAEVAECATVGQLRTAVQLEPRPDPPPGPRPESRRSISRTGDEESTSWRITLPHLEAATVDAALQSHLDALVTAWREERADGESETLPSMPAMVDAFLSLVEAGWDTEVARRPHGQRTTVVVHVDAQTRTGALHLGPLLTDGDRRYVTCDASYELWFERQGQVIGAGRETRRINRRLRRALEYRDRCCVVPGCGATRGLHAHHLKHWEDGGTTDLDNLVLVCPYHHRLHHRGGITLTGPAEHLVVSDGTGRRFREGSLARPPNRPPPVDTHWRGPTGERANWWWYQPYQPGRPHPPPSID